MQAHRLQDCRLLQIRLRKSLQEDARLSVKFHSISPLPNFYPKTIPTSHLHEIEYVCSKDEVSVPEVLFVPEHNSPRPIALSLSDHFIQTDGNRTRPTSPQSCFKVASEMIDGVTMPSTLSDPQVRLDRKP